MTEEKSHILIADDQPENILVLDDILGGTYTVHGVPDGDAALRYLSDGKPADLILLDVVMSGLDGFGVCRRLKANPATRDIPIIFLTGLESDADEALGLSLGAEDFIHKPVSPSIVLARVKNHLKLSRATRLLRERGEDMEHLATEAAGLGVWDYDVSGDHLAWNDEMFRLHGVPRRTLSGAFEDLLIHVHPEDRERMERDYRRALAGEAGIATEFRIIRPDGDTRVFKANAAVRRNSDGKPIRLLGTNWDVTDYRRAQARAEAASIAKSNFLAIISHELRTPLNAISGFGQLLRATVTRPDWRDQLDIICQASDNLGQIIQDILDLSSIEAGRISIAPRPFALLDELSLMSRYFQIEVQRKRLDFTMAIGKGVPSHLVGDSRLLRQVLVNLIGNAVKFTADGSIELAVDVVGGTDREGPIKLAFRVTDTGPGIREENQARIFDVFEQEDNSSTRRHGGVGLGLAIASRLVDRLGGSIELRSEVGFGSCFSFTVVMTRGTAAAAGAAAYDTLPPISDLFPDAAVLVVEDDRPSLKLMLELLAGTNWSVALAEDGKAALHLVRKRRFDLVLLDVQLPEIDGMEVTRQIRRGEHQRCDPTIPIIAISAHAMPEDKARFLGCGMTAYLSKPLDAGALMNTIRAVLQDGRGRER